MTIFRREGLKIGLIQTRINQGEKDDNWQRAEALFELAVQQGIKLIALPEAFVSGVNFIILRQMAEKVPDGPACERLRGLARQHGIYIVAGILEAGDDGKVYDSAVVIDPEGRLLGKYRRRFLWVGERNYVTAGGAPLVVQTELGTIGVLIGYDICFPEACSSFLQSNVDLAICPASVFAALNFNAERIALARAMDHHCYFAYVNATGYHQFANMTYTGRSGIFADPYFLQVQMAQPQDADLGCLAKAGSAEEILIAEIHVDELAKARAARLPFKNDALYSAAGRT